MTDDEWIKNIPNLTNEDLIDELDYCGYDNYYSKIREPIVAEIVKRLNATDELIAKIDKMKCCGNCKYRCYMDWKSKCCFDMTKIRDIENPITCKCENGRLNDE